MADVNWVSKECAYLLSVMQLTVVLLKAKLLSLGLDTSGTKPKLVARVKEAELAVVAVAPAGTAGPSSGDRALPQVAAVLSTCEASG